MTVPIPGRSYDVCVGAGAIASVGSLLPELPGYNQTGCIVAPKLVS